MPGLTVFHSLEDAKKDGFEVYDRFNTGYLVRRKRKDRWEIAIVEKRLKKRGLADPDECC